jgi:hypothetical protein
MEDMRNVQRILFAKHEGTDSLGDLDIEGRHLIERISEGVD